MPGAPNVRVVCNTTEHTSTTGCVSAFVLVGIATAARFAEILCIKVFRCRVRCGARHAASLQTLWCCSDCCCCSGPWCMGLFAPGDAATAADRTSGNVGGNHRRGHNDAPARLLGWKANTRQFRTGPFTRSAFYNYT